MGLLDAIAKFEYNRYVNLWAGRTLANTERGELNGPYYHATFEGFKTPFFPQDYSGNFAGGQFGGRMVAQLAHETTELDYMAVTMV